MQNNFLKYFSRTQARLSSGLLIFDWLENLDIFTPLPRIASFSHLKTRLYPVIMQQCHVFASYAASTYQCARITSSQIKLVRYYEKYRKMCTVHSGKNIPIGKIVTLLG